MVERVLEIINEKGLHARASAKFSEVVDAFDAQAYVSKDGEEVTGESIMGLLMLLAARGDTIKLRCEGAQAEDLANALEKLVADRFDEDF